MDALRQAQFIHTSLESPLQEILHFEREHVIELHAGFVEHAHTYETANQGISFEETLWVLFFHGQKLTVSRISDQLEREGWGGEAGAYRAARRILERVSMTRHTSRLLRSPYSPTIFSSESL